MPYLIRHMAYEIWHMKNDRTSEHSPTRLTILSKPSGLVCLFLIVMAYLLSSSCSKTPPPRLEEKPLPPATISTADAAAPKSAPELPAAKPAPKGAYPESHAEMIKRRRVVIDEGDHLLAVIHGFQSKGWRDSQATQTYVLKDAVGVKLEPQTPKQIVWAGNKNKLPRILGDVIAQSINEQYGFLYYNGARYSWYDPRIYKPEPPASMTHGGRAKAMR